MTTTDTQPSELPQRPRLRPGTPILRRPLAVQIGLDTPEAILITPGGPGLDRWLHLLDGSRGIAELYRSGARLGLHLPDLRRILERLSAAGLIETEDPTSDRGVRLIGAGRVGRGVARLLAAADLTQLELIDDDPVDRRLYPRHSGLGRQASALRAELASERTVDGRGPEICIGPPLGMISGVDGDPIDSAPRRPGRTGAPAGPSAPALTVIASDRLDVDRMVTDALLRADQPHLLIRGADDGIVVGPLVLPGRTACVRCTDLVRCDADPDWPAILAELSRTTSSATDPMIGWAAGMAVTQVLGLLADPPSQWPQTAGATIELGRDYSQRHRAWPRHPACGCSWTSASRNHLLDAPLAG
jgi:hypothetical protein